jgi:hypothetical protein
MLQEASMLVERPENRGTLVAWNAARGGVVGFETGLFVTAAAEYLPYSPGMLILWPLVAGLFVGGLIALIGLLVQHRSRTLNVVEAELEKGLAMLERGMIDEDDYRRIKQQALEAYRPGPRDPRAVIRWAVRGGVAAATIPLLFMAADAISWGIGAFGVAVIAASALVGGGVGAGGGALVHALQARRDAPRLPAARNRMLGE